MTRAEEERRRLYVLCREAALGLYGLCPDFEVNRPKDGKNGDFAASVALALGGALKRRPSELAAELAARIRMGVGERVEPAGKGFLNFYLPPEFLLGALGPVRELPPVRLPLPESPDFERVYPYHRMRKLLKLRGQRPDGRENLSLLTTPEERRLLWAIAEERADAAAAEAMEVCARLGLDPGFPPLAQARYILINNALYLYGTRKELL